MILSIIKIIILLPTFIMVKSSFWTYSSCVQDSNWIYGNGAPIKSWIQSTIPTFNSNDSSFSKIVGIHVTFQYQSIPRVDLIGWFSNDWKTTLKYIQGDIFIFCRRLIFLYVVKTKKLSDLAQILHYVFNKMSGFVENIS